MIPQLAHPRWTVRVNMKRPHEHHSDADRVSDSWVREQSLPDFHEHDRMEKKYERKEIAVERNRETFNESETAHHTSTVENFFILLYDIAFMHCRLLLINWLAH